MLFICHYKNNALKNDADTDSLASKSDVQSGNKETYYNICLSVQKFTKIILYIYTLYFIHFINAFREICLRYSA